MAQFTVDVSNAEEKALLWGLANAGKIQAWLDNAIHNKARQCIDVLIFQETDQRLDLLSYNEKENIVNDWDIFDCGGEDNDEKTEAVGTDSGCSGHRGYGVPERLNSSQSVCRQRATDGHHSSGDAECGEGG